MRKKRITSRDRDTIKDRDTIQCEYCGETAKASGDRCRRCERAWCERCTPGVNVTCDECLEEAAK